MEGQPKKQKLGRFPSNRTLSIPEWFQPTLFLIRTLLKFLHQLFDNLSPLQRWLLSNVGVNVCEELCLWGPWNKCLLLRCFLHPQYAQRAKYWLPVILLVVKWYISVGCSALLKFQYGFALSKHSLPSPSKTAWLSACCVRRTLVTQATADTHSKQGYCSLKKNFQWKSLPFKTAWLTVPCEGYYGNPDNSWHTLSKHGYC